MANSINRAETMALAESVPVVPVVAQSGGRALGAGQWPF